MSMRIALGQINPTVGDLDGNAALIVEMSKRGRDRGAELIAFPELSLCGYPPLDLIEIPSFVEKTGARLERLAAELAPLGVDAVVGYVGPALRDEGAPAANCAALLSAGRVAFVQRKMLLPNYDVFDERRYFEPAERQRVTVIRGLRVGLTICEDVWNDKQFWKRPRYERDPIEELAREGLDLLLNISSSPYHMGKRGLREEMIQAVSRRIGAPVAMVNQVGGNDQLIFDGSSLATDKEGRVCARTRSFEEDLAVYDLATGSGDLFEPSPDEYEAVYDALVLGVGDYVRKCGFSTAVIGLSGGIDSSLTAAVAVDALGAENVVGVSMPGPYSSEGSVRDARLLADALGIRFETLSINDAYQVFTRTLAPVFRGRPPDVTEENLQARLRGVTLMAISNKFSAIVLSTGNKSEVAVGYCTLYGDMAGGLSVISDVPKTLVYELCRTLNRRRPGTISDSVLAKPPSAELRPGQEDTDSLPPYEILDPILKLYVEECRSPEEIADELGRPLELVGEVCRKVDRSEYKRQQGALGLRVTSKAFGMGRRFPIAHKFAR